MWRLSPGLNFDIFQSEFWCGYFADLHKSIRYLKLNLFIHGDLLSFTSVKTTPGAKMTFSDNVELFIVSPTFGSMSKISSTLDALESARLKLYKTIMRTYWLGICIEIFQ